MTALRIYGSIWLLVLTAAGIFYSADLINEVTLPILGFVFSTLGAMAFLAVLPAWLNEDHAKTISAGKRSQTRLDRFRVLSFSRADRGRSHAAAVAAFQNHPH